MLFLKECSALEWQKQKNKSLCKRSRHYINTKKARFALHHCLKCSKRCSTDSFIHLYTTTCGQPQSPQKIFRYFTPNLKRPAHSDAGGNVRGLYCLGTINLYEISWRLSRWIIQYWYFSLDCSWPKMNCIFVSLIWFLCGRLAACHGCSSPLPQSQLAAAFHRMCGVADRWTDSIHFAFSI